MKRILAVDTSGERGGFAIAADDGTVEQLTVEAPDGFAHVLFPKLRDLLDSRGLALEQVDGFAAASGPGSFTGIRVALSAAKGLAEAMSKPLFAISNLQALAWYGGGPSRAAILDARRGQVYGAVYDNSLRLIVPETVIALAAWLPALPLDGLQFVCHDFAPFAEIVAGTRWAGVPVRVAPGSLAEAVARIALGRLLEGEMPDPVASDANYVRRSDAELNWKDI